MNPITIRQIRKTKEEGFNAEYVPIMFHKKGIHFATKEENINNIFMVVEYFLLDNKRIARFSSEENLDNPRRVFLSTHSEPSFLKKFEGKSVVKDYFNTLNTLTENKKNAI